jgi:hypothetical protein
LICANESKTTTSGVTAMPERVSDAG